MLKCRCTAAVSDVYQDECYRRCSGYPFEAETDFECRYSKADFDGSKHDSLAEVGGNARMGIGAQISTVMTSAIEGSARWRVRARPTRDTDGLEGGVMGILES